MSPRVSACHAVQANGKRKQGGCEAGNHVPAGTTEIAQGEFLALTFIYSRKLLIDQGINAGSRRDSLVAKTVIAREFQYGYREPLLLVLEFCS
jgi:hypothetical protein